MASTRQFRKKPVVVDAVRIPYDPDDPIECTDMDLLTDLAEWCGGELVPRAGPTLREWTCIEIPTWEGRMLALPGDWIVKGTEGEFYPCKAAAFDATFEPVED